MDCCRPEPHPVSRVGLASQPSGGLPARSGKVCECAPATPSGPPLSLPKSWWKVWVTESSQRHWKKARPAGVMAPWCFL